MTDITRLLLLAIPQRPEWTTTTDLRDRLALHGVHITPRAVQKRMASLCLEYDAKGLVRDATSKPTRYQYVNRRVVEALAPMGPAEAVAFELCAEHLHAVLPSNLTSDLRWRFDKAREVVERDTTGRAVNWKRKVRRLSPVLRRIAPKVEQHVFEAVSAALYAGDQVRVTYRPRSAPADVEYLLHGLALLEREGALSLVARKDESPRDTDAAQLFHLHRMRTAKPVPGARALGPRGFDLDAFLRSGRADFNLDADAKPVRLRALVDADVAQPLQERPLGEDQRMRPEGARVHLEVSVPATQALLAFLVSYGPKLLVLEPKSIRDEVHARHKAAASAYARSRR